MIHTHTHTYTYRHTHMYMFLLDNHTTTMPLQQPRLTQQGSDKGGILYKIYIYIYIYIHTHTQTHTQ